MKKIYPFFIALLSVALCAVLTFTAVDKKISDGFQNIFLPAKDSGKLLLIDVDDVTAENMGAWPLSRDVYADSLFTLKELGSDSVVFDVDFSEKTLPQVNEDYLENTLPTYLETYFSGIDDCVTVVMEGFSRGDMKARDANDARDMILDASGKSKEKVSELINSSIMAYDKMFANAIKFSQNAYLTLELNDKFINSGNYVNPELSAPNVTSKNDTMTLRYYGIQGATDELLAGAKGTGFSSAISDRDDILRRTNLLLKYDGQYYGQIMLPVLLDKLGNPSVEVSDKFILIKGAKIGEETRDIKILRDEYGSVILKYPYKKYLSYNRLPLWNVYSISVLEKRMVSNLERMAKDDFFLAWGNNTPLDLYNKSKSLKEAILAGDGKATFESYISSKKDYFDALEVFCDSVYEEFLNEELDADEVEKQYIAESFKECRSLLSSIKVLRTEVGERVKDEICIVGSGRISTSALLKTHNEKYFPAIGADYAIANQILTNDFVDDSPIWISVVVALLLCVIFCLISSKMKKPLAQVITGVVILVVLTAAIICLYIFLHTYYGIAVPFCALILTVTISTLIRHSIESKENEFINNAFSQYFSKDVVDYIVKNPGSIRLEGISRDMSAIYTSIPNFAEFSDILNAAELVALMNYYFAIMSDIITGEKGTVDKFLGDTIFAVVGAPLDIEDHANKACLAAIKMKQFDAIINREIAAFSGSVAKTDVDLYSAFKKMVEHKRAIFTRIGINSGYMAAGFIGSNDKKTYTVIGKTMTLAGFIEGANRQYSTGGILISEATRNLIGDKFIVRKLDRVLTPHTRTPIRLYELMDIKYERTENLAKYVAYWDAAMKMFEKGGYSKALDMFKKCLAARPNDRTAEYYVTMLERFFIHGKYPRSGDKFGVIYNPVNPPNMNPEWRGTKNEIKGTFTLLK